MKKISVIAIVIICAFNAFTQLPNIGFDNWETDTSIFGYLPFVPVDTFAYRKPTGWYAVNAITGNKHIGGKFFVEETNTQALFGSASVKLRTDSINVTNPPTKFIIPGFIVNGNFTISLADLLLNNSSLSPAAIPNAGTPLNARRQKLRAYVQYLPIPGDSLLIWAVLKKNNKVVAETRLTHKQATNGTLMLEKDFNYTSCDIPDTVVVMVASSSPDFSTAIVGTSGIEAGSVMIIDSVLLTEFPANFSFPPFANRDQTFTTRNIPKTIDVLTNDYDCSGATINISSVGTPLNGTAVKNANNTITYTPNPNFIGSDSFPYTISTTNGSASAFVFINVFNFSTGIQEMAAENVQIFPNPASSKVTIYTPEFSGIVTYDITSVNGLNLLNGKIADNYTSVDLSGLSSGVYLFKIGNIVKRFSVVR